MTGSLVLGGAGSPLVKPAINYGAFHFTKGSGNASSSKRPSRLIARCGALEAHAIAKVGFVNGHWQ